MDQFLQIITQLTEGFGNTLLLFAVTLLGSIPLGLLFALGSMSAFKPLQYFIKGIIWVIRGTPLMLQILLVSFLPMALGVKTKDIAAFFDIAETWVRRNFIQKRKNYCLFITFVLKCFSVSSKPSSPKTKLRSKK